MNIEIFPEKNVRLGNMAYGEKNLENFSTVLHGEISFLYTHVYIYMYIIILLSKKMPLLIRAFFCINFLFSKRVQTIFSSFFISASCVCIYTLGGIDIPIICNISQLHESALDAVV